LISRAGPFDYDLQIADDLAVAAQMVAQPQMRRRLRRKIDLDKRDLDARGIDPRCIDGPPLSTAASSLPMSISRINREDDQRPSCSRVGGSQPTLPSCRALLRKP
jgi:hypothetical protein